MYWSTQGSRAPNGKHANLLRMQPSRLAYDRSLIRNGHSRRVIFPPVWRYSSVANEMCACSCFLDASCCECWRCASRESLWRREISLNDVYSIQDLIRSVGITFANIYNRIKYPHGGIQDKERL